VVVAIFLADDEGIGGVRTKAWKRRGRLLRASGGDDDCGKFWLVPEKKLLLRLRFGPIPGRLLPLHRLWLCPEDC
jgi:hypothetical protein